MNLRHLNPPLWGFSIALSWTWGLGLFFSVQMAIQFGLPGLLAFAIPNAIGLTAFGWFADYISKKHASSIDFEKHFLDTVGEFRWVFLLYQVAAIALTFFALFKYVFVPLDVNPWVVALVVLGAGLLLGEQFKINVLKWSHFAMALVIILSIVLIGWGGASYFHTVGRFPEPRSGQESILSWSFGGFFVPILIGFLLGPWLDIQQWQRAIQIRREKSSISAAYTVGGILFFLLLLFHGTLGHAIWSEGLQQNVDLSQQTADGLFHAKDAIVRFLFLSGIETPLLFRVMYLIFLCLCIISTIDSGYVALKWFQTDALKKADNSVLVALIPKSFLESPIPPFVLSVLLALVGLPFHFELEYYMALYGSFFVGYEMVFLFRTTYVPRFTHFTQTTLVALAGFSLGIFGLGYFEGIPFLMMAGAVIPLAHAIVCIATRKAVEEIVKSGVIDRVESAGVMGKLAGGDVKGAVSSTMNSIRPPKKDPSTGEQDSREANAPADALVEASSGLPEGVEIVSGAVSSRIEGKTFIHTLTATYQDTNSVGNVYFAQYAMWVGKTRELFFRHVLPEFDLRTTTWYILTRSYEHKFLQESREFDQIEVRIRISAFNRKFVTMEHQIFDGSKKMLGKGKQVLLFVSSKDYSILDIPPECYKAFLPYL